MTGEVAGLIYTTMLDKTKQKNIIYPHLGEKGACWFGKATFFFYI